MMDAGLQASRKLSPSFTLSKTLVLLPINIFYMVKAFSVVAEKL
jgi:hypothetical protein